MSNGSTLNRLNYNHSTFGLIYTAEAVSKVKYFINRNGLKEYRKGRKVYINILQRCALCEFFANFAVKITFDAAPEFSGRYFIFKYPKVKLEKTPCLVKSY